MPNLRSPSVASYLLLKSVCHLQFFPQFFTLFRGICLSGQIFSFWRADELTIARFVCSCRLLQSIEFGGDIVPPKQQLTSTVWFSAVWICRLESFAMMVDDLLLFALYYAILLVDSVLKIEEKWKRFWSRVLSPGHQLLSTGTNALVCNANGWFVILSFNFANVLFFAMVEWDSWMTSLRVSYN